MTETEAKDLLKFELKLSEEDIYKLDVFKGLLLERNLRYNLISKSTENCIWSRHILDSAQLIKYFNLNSKAILADFGSGAGFPGLVLAVINNNLEFHVKLYEKSAVKREFLNEVIKKTNTKCVVVENVYDGRIDANIIVSRAFKKLDEIIRISREIVRKPHKIIILKGKNAQAEINNVSLPNNYSYKMVNSITNADSKIILIEAT
mgnify:CR=1 FL=1|jgi:16S rRNA (guanine527-N7)-methyltransferase|tara:strand:- start:166 stop:780 length:615 start_codon:yes stop_codon:yes gene_type:complete